MKISLRTIQFVLTVLSVVFSNYTSWAMEAGSVPMNVRSQELRTNVVKAGVLGVPVPFVTPDTDMLSEDRMQTTRKYANGVSTSKVQSYLIQNSVNLYEGGSESSPLLVRRSEAHQTQN